MKDIDRIIKEAFSKGRTGNDASVRAIILESDSDKFVSKGIVSGMKGAKKIQVFIDTGATDSLIDTSLAGEIGACTTGNVKRIYGVTSDYMVLTEVEIHLRLIKNKGEVSGEVRLSMLDGVSKITGGSPLLLGMDFLTFERGRKAKLMIE